MKRLLAGVLLWCLPLTALAQQRPLVTERAEIVEKGHVLIDVGMEFLQEASFPFSGLKGELTRAGVAGFRFGASDNVEIQILGTIQNILNVEERHPAPNTPNLTFSGSSTSDVGDFSFATKLRMRKEGGVWPAMAFRVGAELPNASNESGLGNDETNVFGSLLLQKQFGKLTLLSNLGLVILGDPTTPGSQDDLFAYGLAFLYPLHPRLQVILDAYGRAGPGGIGTEEQTRLRVGSQIQAAGLYWDAALFVGFRQTDPSSGFILGVSKELPFF